MSERLWNFYDGEPWLDNPRVWLFNEGGKRRKKGKKSMARRRRTSRRRTGRRAAPRRRRAASNPRRARRAYVSGSAPIRRLKMNPRRRRRSVRRRSSLRGYRRNPGISLAGLNLTELLKGAGAVIIAPMIEKQLMPLLPATVSGTTYGRWAVKLGAALGVWYGAKYAFGRRSADVVAIALGSSLIADAIDEFVPQLTGGLSAYTRAGGQMRAYQRKGLGLVMPGQMTRGLRGIGPGRTVSQGVSTASDIFAPPF